MATKLDCVLCGEALPMVRRDDMRGGKAINYQVLAPSVKTEIKSGRQAHGACVDAGIAQDRYVKAREAYLAHKKSCYRPGCGINAHGDGCAEERKLYEATRDSLRRANRETGSTRASLPTQEGTR